MSREKDILFWERLTTDNNECLGQGLEPTCPADYHILPNCAKCKKPVPGSAPLKSYHRERVCLQYFCRELLFGCHGMLVSNTFLKKKEVIGLDG